MAKLSIFIIFLLGIISTSSASADALEEGPGYVECVIWCAAHHFRLDECAIPALHRKGPCYECGPCKTAASKKLCDNKCVDTSNDASNCGVCGNKCANGCCQVGKCLNNAGLEWAYFRNPDRRDNVDIDGIGYSIFDPTVFKTLTPLYTNTTTATSLYHEGSGFFAIYDSPPVVFPPDYFVLNHRGYIHAIQGGTYTFTTQSADEIVLFWVGPEAYSNWDRSNADLEDAWYGPGSGQLKSFDVNLEAGQYYALRIVFANAQLTAQEIINVRAPDGTLILGKDTVANPYVIRYDACHADEAPPYPPFGQET
ncbi:hypothetical protein V495_04727 [Pseudogymnoascus sp. VKM F-4514 (FW-929)]|nr:hypothetical protein V490_00583 [Pseudogymnoascus sp. VKM F-3557]KFY41955.1 hypothetical protein V495_04727 [Pseudogymnoascus sp. VKM F-4514 (FW-929)]KFY61638.1 hypothetical protein V497_02829 [Pseudogymnoascus sp. VKM F-4516 (FW-969)]